MNRPSPAPVTRAPYEVPPESFPGWWKFQPPDVRERKPFLLTRIDGVTLEPGFGQPPVNTAQGVFPAGKPSASLGFLIVNPNPKEIAALHKIKLASVEAVLSGALDLRRPGDDQPDKPLTEEPDLIGTREGGTPIRGAVVPWVDSEQRIHLAVLSAIHAARMADTLLPPPAWVSVPEAWWWPWEKA